MAMAATVILNSGGLTHAYNSTKKTLIAVMGSGASHHISYIKYTRTNRKQLIFCSNNITVCEQHFLGCSRSYNR